MASNKNKSHVSKPKIPNTPVEPIPTVTSSPPRILLHPSDPNAAGPIYRIAAPADALKKQGYATTLIDFRWPSGDSLKALAPEVIVVQQPYRDEHITALREYKKNGIFTVYDTDDDFSALHDDNPAKGLLPPDVLSRMTTCAGLCDRVVVSTEKLAERVQQTLRVPANKVVVSRNRIPRMFFALAEDAKKAKRKSDMPRIGWAGGLSHKSDLAILAAVVRRTQGQFQWVFMGSAPEGVEDLVELRPATSFMRYPSALAEMDLDIAVVPLADSDFNACKSDLKILEYSAVGFPVIASPSPVLNDRPDLPRSAIVTPIDNDADSWIIAIEDYLRNTEVRKANAQTLHDWVKKSAVIEEKEGVSEWIKAWTPSTRTVFTPSSDNLSEEVVFVGEPIGEPAYATVAEARHDHPAASILFVRPGAFVSSEQVTSLIKAIAPEEGKFLASVSSWSNNGDYPVVGKFSRLEGSVARDMSLAAGALQDAPVPLPYASGPVILLSTAALGLAGLPNEKRYGGDTELAIVDWSMRITEIIANAHIALPSVYVPTVNPHPRTTSELKTYLSEIATWHPIFNTVQDEAVKEDRFSTARKHMDLAYAAFSYHAPFTQDYPSWLSLHDSASPRVVDWAQKEMTTWPDKPGVAIVMPAYKSNPQYLKEAIQSIKEQAYPWWTLYVVDDSPHDAETKKIVSEFAKDDTRIVFSERKENGHICKASNDALALAYKSNNKYVMFVDHDDTLTPLTLMLLVKEMQENKSLTAVYADSDLISSEGAYHSPDFKPGFDYDLLLSQNYVCHPCLYILDKVKDVDGFKEGKEGSQDYDLILRYIEHTGRNIGHVSQVLYHWRQAETSVSADISNKPYVLQAAADAVTEHLTRTHQPVFIGPHPNAQMHHMIRYLPPSPAPKASIIIITQTNARQLNNCVASILSRTVYPNYQVVVRQVGGDPGITEIMNKWAKKDTRIKFVHGAGGGADFNYSLINNAVSGTPIVEDSEVIVFLNDDTEIITDVWLNDIVGTALREDVGAVGVKTIYPDKRIQHNGISLDPFAPMGEIAMHNNAGLPFNYNGGASRAHIAHEVTAVTGACLGIRKSVFDAIGHFNVVDFPLDYGDVELCLRLMNAGKVNVVLSHILVVHAEGATKRTRNDLTHMRMLMSEEKLVASDTWAEAVSLGNLTRYSNVNIAHEPSGQMLRSDPVRAWQSSGGELPVAMLIEGKEEDRERVYVNGERPVSAMLDGPYLTIVEPPMAHLGRIDLREQESLDEVISWLGISQFILRGIGKGSTSECLGALTNLANAGMKVSYQPSSFESVCPRLFCTNDGGPCNHKYKEGVDACQTCVDRCGSDHGYVSVASYRNDWSRFYQAINASTDGANVIPSAE